ncbi:hypothetical protein WJX73_006163 [Symbiochloris irregularis]|uniref:Uncharacterized protein n=1 Tax=Symbiochloris irregularis TaxID=706552 RepID=A0AAW1NUU8_9CHLO
MDGFGARQRAIEGTWYRQEELRQLTQRAEKLRAQGQINGGLTAMSESAVRAPGTGPVSLLDVPTSLVSRRACEVPYAHTPSKYPAARVSSFSQWAHAPQVSFGRARWDADGVSIFSVQEGKTMAQTPQRLPTAFEAKRAAKISQAALDSPLVQGYRLLPQFTPGRAFMWGSILAMWGTAGLAVSAARQLDIHTAEGAAEKLRATCAPMIDAVSSAFSPLKGQLASSQAAERSLAADNSLTELARRMKVKLSAA